MVNMADTLKHEFDCTNNTKLSSPFTHLPTFFQSDTKLSTIIIHKYPIEF